jgi:phospholipase C
MAVMDYYDGNTVTALWNYAQRFAMSDNSYGTGYGPSTPGAFEIVNGNPFGAVCGPQDAVFGPQPECPAAATMSATAGVVQQPGPGTVYGDPDPQFDVCAHGATAALGGATIGDRLRRLGVTWGWFQGGFASPGYAPGQPQSDDLNAVCTSHHTNAAGASVADYSAHHEPFQYFASTANPRHLPPASVAAIGHSDQADHQYDLADFWAAADSGDLPAVSYLKAAKYQDGHAGYSDPLDEQTFLVDTLNRLQHLPEWHDTAVVIAYDDSDGWYDHVMPPVLFGSQTPLDAVTSPGACGAPSLVPRTVREPRRRRAAATARVCRCW